MTDELETKIVIYNPTDVPYGVLSNNLIHYFTVGKLKYPSVTNFIYSQIPSFGAHQSVIRNAPTRPFTKTIDIDRRLEDKIFKTQSNTGRYPTKHEIAYMKKQLILEVSNLNLPPPELLLKCLYLEKKSYTTKAVNTYFRYVLSLNPEMMSTLLSTNKYIYYVISEDSLKHVPSGVDTYGVGENIVGKVLMEIRQEKIRDITDSNLKQKREEDYRKVYDAYLFNVTVVNLINKRKTNITQSMVEQEAKILKDSDVPNLERAIQRINQLYTSGKLPLVTALINRNIPQSEWLAFFLSEYKSQIDEIKVVLRKKIVWAKWMYHLISEKYPALSEKEKLDNIVGFRTELPIATGFTISKGGVKETISIKQEDLHFANRFGNGIPDISATQSALLEKMETEVYYLFTSGKLEAEVEKKIKDELEAKDLLNIENKDEDDEDVVIHEEEDAEDKKSNDSSSSSKSSSSSSSSDDERGIKASLRPTQKYTFIEIEEAYQFLAQKTLTMKDLIKFTRKFFHGKQKRDLLYEISRTDSVADAKRILHEALKEEQKKYRNDGIDIKQLYYDRILKYATQDPLVIGEANRLKIDTSESSKDKLMNLYKIVLIQKLNLPMPFSSSLHELKSVVKELLKDEEKKTIIFEKYKGKIDRTAYGPPSENSPNKKKGRDLTPEEFFSVLERKLNEGISAQELFFIITPFLDKETLDSYKKRIKLDYSIPELERRLGIRSIDQQLLERQILERKDLGKEGHLVVEMNKEGSEYDLTPYYLDILNQPVISDEERAVSIYQAIDKNGASYVPFSLFHVFDVPIMINGYKFSSGFEYVVFFLMSNVRSM